MSGVEKVAICNCCFRDVTHRNALFYVYKTEKHNLKIILNSWKLQFEKIISVILAQKSLTKWVLKKENICEFLTKIFVLK